MNWWSLRSFISSNIQISSQYHTCSHSKLSLSIDNKSSWKSLRNSKNIEITISILSVSYTFIHNVWLQSISIWHLPQHDFFVYAAVYLISSSFHTFIIRNILTVQLRLHVWIWKLIEWRMTVCWIVTTQFSEVLHLSFASSLAFSRVMKTSMCW